MNNIGRDKSTPVVPAQVIQLTHHYEDSTRKFAKIIKYLALALGFAYILDAILLGAVEHRYGDMIVAVILGVFIPLLAYISATTKNIPLVIMTICCSCLCGALLVISVVVLFLSLVDSSNPYIFYDYSTSYRIILFSMAIVMGSLYITLCIFSSRFYGSLTTYVVAVSPVHPTTTVHIAQAIPVADVVNV